MLPRRLIEPVLLVVLSGGSVMGQIIYDDGQQHVLNEDARQPVIVSNQSVLDVQARMWNSSLEDEPTLTVDDSRIIVNGGSIGAGDLAPTAVVASNSSLVLNSGEIGGWNPAFLAENSEIVLNGGRIHGVYKGMIATGSSTITINGGEVSDEDDGAIALSIGDSTTLRINDGIVHCTGTTGTGLLATGVAYVEMTGGRVGTGVGLRDSTFFRMTGGRVSAAEIASGFSVGDNSRLEIYGGTIHYDTMVERAIWASDNATVTILGGDFNFPMFEPISATEGTLTGILTDGSSIAWRFRRDATATIMLVPEPSGVLLLLVGSGLCLCRRRR